jgi:ATP-dependent Clp protease ATP-binding subunit ClpA
MEIDSMPVELDELERAIRQLEIERQALKNEPDSASRQRLQTLEKQLAEYAEQRNSLRARWEQEKALIGRVRSLKQRPGGDPAGGRAGRASGRLRKGGAPALRRGGRAAEAAG